MKRGAWGLWGVLGCLALACGSSGLGRTFEPGWAWDRGASAEQVIRKLAGQAAAPDVSVAVGVTGHGLVGRSLPAGPLWAYEGEVDVLPSLIADVVAFTGGGKVTLLDVRTGKVRFAIDSGGRRLEGMGYDGKFAVLLLVDEDDARPDQIVVVSEHGQVRHSATTLDRVGTPAALGGLGFVPWSHEYVSVFDLSTGETLGRILVRDGIHRVAASGDKLLIFGRGALLLSPALAKNPNLPSLRVPKLDLPGEPSWPEDGSKPRPARAQAVGIYAYPRASGDALAFAHDTIAATYFDIALGFEVQGTVRWATHFERSIVGAVAGRDGLGLCLEDGSLWQVGLTSGEPEPLGSLESRLRACVLQIAAAGKPQAPSHDVEAQILAAVTGTGPNMAALHALLVDDLARRKGDAATRALLAIAQDPLSSTTVVDRAASALGRRSQGADAMIEALEGSAPAAHTSPGTTATPGLEPSPEPERADQYKRSTKRAPPISALAQALGAIGDKRAASPLARYLGATSVSAEQAQAVLEALFILGGPAQVAQVLEFFATYRAAGGEPEFILALSRAAVFVDKNGTAEQRTQVQKAASDSLTHPELRKQLGLVLGPAPP